MGVYTTQSTVSQQTDEHRYQEILRHVVETAADSGQVVMIGQASQVILAEQRDDLHVHTVAPLQARIAYIALREGLDEAGAQAQVQLKDRDRSRYLQTVYHHQVDDPMLYDLVMAYLAADDFLQALAMTNPDLIRVCPQQLYLFDQHRQIGPKPPQSWWYAP